MIEHGYHVAWSIRNAVWSAVVFRLYTFAREDRVVLYNATHFTFRSLFRGFPPFSFFRQALDRAVWHFAAAFIRSAVDCGPSVHEVSRKRDTWTWLYTCRVSSNHINRSLILQWCSHDVNIYFILFHGSTVEKVGFNNTKDISLIHNRNFILFYIFISDWKIESDEI